MSMEIRLITTDKEVIFTEYYHDGPYVTEFLCSEAFDETFHDRESGVTIIPVETMENRLRPSLDLLKNTQRKVYGKVIPSDIKALKRLVAEYRLATDGEKMPVLKVFY